MKRLATALFLFVFFGLSAAAQPTGYKQAALLARQQKRLILLQYQPAGCSDCDRIYTGALADTAVQARAAAFIFLPIGGNHPERAALAARYGFGSKTGFYVIDTTGRIIHSFPATTSAALAKGLDVALAKARAASRLGAYEKAYHDGDRTPKLFEALLTERKSLGLDTDSLLEEYASSLSFDSVKSTRVLQFIARLAPILGTRADAVFRNDQLRFDHAWYVLPMRERVQLNTEIIAKSRRHAIAEGNEAYAIAVAGFAQSTYVSDTAAGLRAYENLMMDYYREVGDTAHYLPIASGYYERYLMRLPVDSLKRSPGAAAYSRELTRAASAFLNFSSAPERLAQATRWMRTAIEVYSEPDALDTYARLLYAQYQSQEAMAVEQWAIDLLKKNNRDAREKEAVLDKMKKGALKRMDRPVQ